MYCGVIVHPATPRANTRARGRGFLSGGRSTARRGGGRGRPGAGLLYVDGKAAGVVEAKKMGTTLTGVEVQTRKHFTAG